MDLELEKELLREVKRFWDKQDFYSAHEILEDIWRLFPKGDRASRNCYQGLIRLAIAYNHYLCGRKESALRVLNMAYLQLKSCQQTLRYIDICYLLAFLERHIQALKEGRSIEDFPKLEILFSF